MKTIFTALVAVGALAAPATAAATVTATGPIGPKQAVQDAAHVEFQLPDGYGQLVGALAGTPSLGTYRQQLPSCNVDLGVGAQLTANRPVKDGKRLRAVARGVKRPVGAFDLKLRRTVRAGGATFYLGAPITKQFPDQRTPLRAVAVMRAPSSLAQGARKWLVVTASSTLWQCTAEQEREVVAGTLPSDLWRAVRTAKVASGKATPPAGLKRVVA